MMGELFTKVLLASLLSISVNCLNEGNACIRDHDGSPGICRKVEDCPKAREEYYARIKLTICGHINENPIVCCLTQKTISELKCVEYAKHMKKPIRITSLSLNAQPFTVSVSQCAYATALIVNGEKTNVGEYPHMAAIGWRDLDGSLKFACGGSLISERFVLTVAHCGSYEGNAPVLVRLGDQNLKTRDDGANEVDYAIERFIKHESYSRRSHYYDIAVIKLTQDVTFSKFIRPACLWQSFNINQTNAIATGWGYTKNYGNMSDELMKVSLDIINNVKCNEITPEVKLINGIMETQLCAGALEGGKDTCNGDSGGPLQVVTPGNKCVFHIIGVTSFGPAYCGLKNSAGVYTRISSYIDWIEQKVWG